MIAQLTKNKESRNWQNVPLPIFTDSLGHKCVITHSFNTMTKQKILITLLKSITQQQI